jgi:hypothetical protein
MQDGKMQNGKKVFAISLFRYLPCGIDWTTTPIPMNINE